MKKYRLHCQTDNKNEFVISSSIPTDCPVDAGHIIDAASICVVEDDVKVNDGTAKNLTLADYKQLRLNEIDARTEELIAVGFTFDSKQFSLSLEAQTQWTTIKTNAADFTFPMGISTIDSNEYSLTEANVVPFWGTGLATVKAHLDSGRALKVSIKDAVDQAAVDAVVDTR